MFVEQLGLERRDEAHGPEHVDDGGPVEPEVVEDLEADDARADDAGPGAGLLLEDPHVEPGRGQAGRDAQAARPGPDDDDVRSVHVQTLGSLDSHLPRNVIQNDRAMSSRSTQKLMRRI